MSTCLNQNNRHLLTHDIIEGFGFFHAYDIYDGGTRLVSFHWTKAGAYKAMRAKRVADWENEREAYVRADRDEWKRSSRSSTKHLQHTVYAVWPHKIKVEE
jgi:hypothetical protein